MYLVELGINGVVDESDDKLPLHRRLDDLRSIEDVWREMSFVQSSALNVPANGPLELCGDIILKLLWALPGNDTYAQLTRFSIMKVLTVDAQAVRSDVLEEPVAQTVLRGELIKFSSFIWDAEYDVLILLYG